jgi:cytochrome P450
VLLIRSLKISFRRSYTDELHRENANSIPAVFWMIVEAVQRPDLLSQALGEVLTSQSWSQLSTNSSMDIESLCNMPILQSMYAETLRLYTSLFALRSAPHGDFNLGNFTIPKDELIAVDTRVGAMNRSIWNVGDAQSPHPIDQFWAERFLVYPDDPKSGPLRFNSSKPKAFAPPAEAFDPSHPNNNGKGPQFTMDGLSGAWFPFGGGTRQCPGRNFAKQEIILSFALMFSKLDIELLGDADSAVNVRARKPNMKYYGLGTLPPRGKVPFRIRRRV